MLSQDVARQARKAQVKGKTVVLIYRGSDFTKHTRRQTLHQSTDIANEIYSTACTALDALPDDIIFRLIGVGIAGFEESVQLELFERSKPAQAWEVSEKAIDKLVDRFGSGIIVRGSEL